MNSNEENQLSEQPHPMSPVQRLVFLKLATREDLEFLLRALCKFGKPTLHRFDKGWYCKVTMHVAAKGTSFEIASDFTCELPTLAARECAYRIITTLEAMEVGF